MMVEAFVLVRVGSSEALNFMKTVKEEVRKIEGVKEKFSEFLVAMTLLLGLKLGRLKN